ncbi:DUF4136 domain-containing protein [Sphingomonas sp. Tas61C01]|uniref:DUF4136 domain-containing protein n=1 Tax=Sphingomonas sp. Tas61C01 TaxID=3458297 RepID=UPI00403EB7FF
MITRNLLALGLAAVTVAGCTTAGPLPPTNVVRYHLGAPIARGTVSVEPATAPGVPASLEFKTYAAAVESQLLKAGYTLPATGATPDYIATVGFIRREAAGPPRRSAFSIGLGGGSFSGGRNGGVGLGGGVGIPIGGGGASTVLVAELAVTIKRRVDQSPIWEGRAQGVSDIKSADQQAGKLATALFTGFPGESGRTIEVR